MPSPTRDRQAPWPAQTAASPPRASSSSSKRKIKRRSIPPHADRRRSVGTRDGDGDHIPDEAAISAAMTQCEVFSGNEVISCFPNTTTTVPQHDFATFVWNSRLPEFTQTNLVNIYLLSATETNDILLQWHNVTNPTGQAGVIHAPVNDTWWGSRGDEWDGTNLPFLFQWAITRADKTLDGTVTRQPIFTGLQTTFADSIVASMSSTSAAAASSSSAAAASRSSASAASAASASAASASSVSQGGGLGGSLTSGASGTATGASATASSTSGSGSGNVQSSSGSTFPHWAIAVIVVLGFLALLAGGILAFFIMRRMRQRRGADLSHRGSMGSSTPMMRNADRGGEPQSPVGAPAAYGAISHRPPSPEVHDGASTTSRVSDAALFSGADAAVMADAFRAALRKPNFTGRPVEEGESPEMEGSGEDPVNAEASGLLDRELAEEGRDIRSVGSSRGVKVETLSDAADDTDRHQ